MMSIPDFRSDRIGPYVIESLIGAGAHGRVYRAHHMDRPDISVAIKFVSGRGNLDRLLLEPELLSRLDHPGIVRLLDYFVEGSDLIVVLAFVKGETLDEWLQRKGVMPASEVRRLMIQMAQALGHAHERNIQHRDIKLSNIIATGPVEQRRFVLTDFGISRLMQGIQSSKQTAGTWLYMSPEQLRGRPVKQSDLWSLGVVAYRLLTGCFPYEGRTYEELSNAVLYQDPVPVQKHLPTFEDAELEHIIRDLLEKHLTQRTSSAHDLLHQLGAAQIVTQQRDRQAHVHSPQTWKQRERRRIRGTWLGFWCCAILMILPLGPILGMTGLLAVLCFYLGHVAPKQIVRRTMLTCAAAISLGTMVWSVVGPPNYLISILSTKFEGVGQRTLEQAYRWICLVYFLAVAPVTVHFFVKARRLRRDMERRGLSDIDASIPDAWQMQLRRLLAWHPLDLQLQHRYAESLLASGRIADAVVEAQLLLESDPYNFAANLLLAQSYFDLNRWKDCQAECEKNLGVSGQCFEFADLRDQCLRHLGQTESPAITSGGTLQ